MRAMTDDLDQEESTLGNCLLVVFTIFLVVVEYFLK